MEIAFVLQEFVVVLTMVLVLWLHLSFLFPVAFFEAAAAVGGVMA